MKMRVGHVALVFGIAGAVSVGCGSDDDSATTPKGGAAGVAGASGKTGTAGRGGSGGKGGSSGGSGDKGGSSGNAATGNEAGVAGEGASAGMDQGGAAGVAGALETAGSGPSDGGSAGAVSETHVYTAEQVAHGKVLVGSVALCGGCHTAAATGSPVLGGNASFAGGTVPAPNLTDDATGIGEWTDAQVINAFRNGIDDEGRHLNPVMPYWLFHNMSDADALSVVAYLRSLPHAVAEIGATNPEVAPVTPLAPSSLPNTSLASTNSDYAAAQRGKYLVSGVAQCVKCHSPAAAGQPPVAGFFTGVSVAAPPKIFASNITPDVTTGIGGWTAADVAKALKVGTNKDGVTLCGAMPSATKGYGTMSDEDALAIGVYLTTIPAVSNPTAAPSLEPACPAP